MIRNNDTNHTETHKQQQITNTKLDEIKALIKLQGGDETAFLEKYFGKDYAVILGHPQTYHNFTTLLKQTNKSADELLKEREELLKKIASQSFSPKLQKQIDKAFKELRYEDARELIDGFLEINTNKEKETVRAHYLKALSYMEEKNYLKAKNEFESYIPIKTNQINILYDFAKNYDILKDFEKSLMIYKNIFEIKKKNINFDSVLMLPDYIHIGHALYNLNRLLESIKYYEQSLKIALDYCPHYELDIYSISINYKILTILYYKIGNNKKMYIYLKKYIYYKSKIVFLTENELEINREYLNTIKNELGY